METVLRPIARWVPELGADGRARLVMVWSVPDLDAAAVAELGGIHA
jgi:hypothetical protein